MTDRETPERIWAWTEGQDAFGEWAEKLTFEHRATEYVRADLHAARIEADAAEIERLRERLGEVRMCVACGAVRDAALGRSDPGNCGSPDACTWDVTPQEAADFWRDEFHKRNDKIARLRARIKGLREVAERIRGDAEKATLGPWAVSVFNKVRNDDGSWHETFKVTPQRGIYGSLWEANARLIAAAPDMARAIKTATEGAE